MTAPSPRSVIRLTDHDGDAWWRDFSRPAEMIWRHHRLRHPPLALSGDRALAWLAGVVLLALTGPVAAAARPSLGT
jgi:hypothetical protein